MNPYKEMLRKFFSEYVGALRKRRGLTQEQMAENLCITGRAYSDLERGIYCFSVVALAFLLRGSFAALIGSPPDIPLHSGQPPRRLIRR